MRVHAVLAGPVDTDMSRGLDAQKAAPSWSSEQSSTEWSPPARAQSAPGSFDDGRAVGKAEKAQHVSGVIDERVERGRADGLAEMIDMTPPDTPHVAATRPSTRATAAEDPTSGHRPGVSPDEQLARRPSVEEGIEGAAAGTTCGSQTTANTAPSTSRSRRRPERVRPIRNRSHHPGGLPRSRGRPWVRRQK